jgi:transcriptional regulator with XRE-family HTH domain
MNHVSRSIGAALFRAREAAGISREGLQMKAGVHRNTIARYENGEAIPTLKTLIVLADALGYELRVSFVRKEG